jgi:chemotaxis protein MotB
MLTASLPAPDRLRRPLAACAALLVGLLGLTLGGCSGSNNALLEANRALQDRNTALTQENESLHNANQQLQAALAARDKAIAELQALVNDLRNGREDIERRLNSISDRIPSGFGNIALDQATDQALRDLAAQHPDLLEYDAERGLIRFKADVTFDSGSDRVKDAARPTLRQFAQILNGPAAQYDVRIVGHTDAQPIRRVAAQHPTNMHLSCHRAISVRAVLGEGGVSQERMEAAGRGEFDPLVPNGRDGKQERNRRVEVYLTKPSRSGNGRGGVSPVEPAVTSTPAPAKPAPRPASGEDIMK